MNILLINQPVNNRGDESAHKGLLRSLIKQCPSVNITVLFIDESHDTVEQFKINDSHVSYVELQSSGTSYYKIVMGLFRHGMIKYTKISPTVRKIIKLYKENDIILCAPGGISMGGFQNWSHLYYLHLAKYLGKKLAYYGRSFGPFPSREKNQIIYKKYSFEILNYFSFLSIRDKRTEVLAKELNLNYVSTVDSAFLDSPYVSLPKEILYDINNTEYIILVPNLLIWHYNYKDRISKTNVVLFFKTLIERLRHDYVDKKIIMLPQTFNYHTYLGDDIYFFKELKGYFSNDNSIIVMSDQFSSDIQQTIISKACFLIGARYHSVVFALNNNTPFIALSYEHKISGLLESLGKTDCMIDIENSLISRDLVYKTVDEICHKIHNIKKDEYVQCKAKKTAQYCLDQFIKKFLKNEN